MPCTRRRHGAIADLLMSIDLDVRAEMIKAKTFVPGIAIHHGALVVDQRS